MTKKTETGLDASKLSTPESGNDSEVLDHRELVKEQAALWLIRIGDNALAPNEIDDLREWIGRSDFHQEYLIRLSQNWDDMAVLEELAELFAVPRAGATQQKHSSHSWLSRWFSFPGFAVAVSVALCVTVLLNSLIVPVMTLQTAIGEQRTEQLDDGTVLTINTDSELSVDYSGDNRIVRLNRGEVNFNVAKDPHRPFLVYAGDGLVWAVGTAFNIRLEDSGVDLTVTEGRVKVYSGIVPTEPLPALTADAVDTDSLPSSGRQTEAFVRAGEVLQYDQVIAQRGEMQAEQLRKKLAWQSGALIFKGETLEQAVVEIRRYTNKKLQIVDPTIKDKKVGGYYKTDDIDGLLRTMSQSFGLRIAYQSNNEIHLSSQ